jgi:Tfp pilus assembly protein PilF
MQRSPNVILAIAFWMAFTMVGNAQIDDICRDAGVVPSLDSPFAQVPYIYGKVIQRGTVPGAKEAKVMVIFSEAGQPERRLSVYGSGNYCFKRSSASGGVIVVEVGGVEAARRSLPSFGAGQQREDFEISPTSSDRISPPGTVSAKFIHPRNEKTANHYGEAAAAERAGDPDKAIGLFKRIVALDEKDFIAWAKLGELLVTRNRFPEADAAFKRSLELKLEYTPAWVNVGKLRIAQKQIPAAIEIFKHAISLEPESARLFQMLGKAYLQAKMGTLGAAALNRSLELDPSGMAESHLYLARLYDLAGAKAMASREFALFLTKVKDHPDKKKFEKYIKDNPE